MYQSDETSDDSLHEALDEALASTKPPSRPSYSRELLMAVMENIVGASLATTSPPPLDDDTKPLGLMVAGEKYDTITVDLLKKLIADTVVPSDYQTLSELRRFNTKRIKQALLSTLEQHLEQFEGLDKDLSGSVLYYILSLGHETKLIQNNTRSIRKLQFLQLKYTAAMRFQRAVGLCENLEDGQDYLVTDADNPLRLFCEILAEKPGDQRVNEIMAFVTKPGNAEKMLRCAGESDGLIVDFVELLLLNRVRNLNIEEAFPAFKETLSDYFSRQERGLSDVELLNRYQDSVVFQWLVAAKMKDSAYLQKATFRECLAINPSYEPALLSLGELLPAAEKEGHYLEFLFRHPNHPEPFMALAECQPDNRHYRDRSIEVCDKNIQDSNWVIGAYHRRIAGEASTHPQLPELRKRYVKQVLLAMQATNSVQKRADLFFKLKDHDGAYPDGANLIKALVGGKKFKNGKFQAVLTTLLMAKQYDKAIRLVAASDRRTFFSHQLCADVEAFNFLKRNIRTYSIFFTEKLAALLTRDVMNANSPPRSGSWLSLLWGPAQSQPTQTAEVYRSVYDDGF